MLHAARLSAQPAPPALTMRRCSAQRGVGARIRRQKRASSTRSSPLQRDDTAAVRRRGIGRHLPGASKANVLLRGASQGRALAPRAQPQRSVSRDCQRPIRPAAAPREAPRTPPARAALLPGHLSFCASTPARPRAAPQRLAPRCRLPRVWAHRSAARARETAASGAACARRLQRTVASRRNCPYGRTTRSAAQRGLPRARRPRPACAGREGAGSAGEALLRQCRRSHLSFLSLCVVPSLLIIDPPVD